jgi:drug/metabolite transporter (DMT)-like permease
MRAGVDRWGARVLGAPSYLVNATRRTSPLMAVGLGRAIFLEPESGRRLLAALLAVAGIACLLPAR